MLALAFGFAFQLPWLPAFVAPAARKTSEGRADDPVGARAFDQRKNACLTAHAGFSNQPFRSYLRLARRSAER